MGIAPSNKRIMGELERRELMVRREIYAEHAETQGRIAASFPRFGSLIRNEMDKQFPWVVSSILLEKDPMPFIEAWAEDTEQLPREARSREMKRLKFLDEVNSERLNNREPRRLQDQTLMHNLRKHAKKL